MPTPHEIDGRAYANFVKDALEYFVTHDFPTHPRIIQRFLQEIHDTWANMNQDQKQYYTNMAIEQFNRLHYRQRRFQRIVDNILDNIEREAENRD